MPRSDEELMLEYAAGNARAFEELFNRYGGRLYNLFLRNIGDQEVAQDLLQECFLRVIQARNRYESRKTFSSWIFTIAMNLLRDKYRANHRYRQRFERGVLNEEVLPATHRPDDAMDKAARNQMNEILQQAINSLPKEQREIIILCKYAGLSFQEIGETLNISPAAAKQKAYRGMQNLRKKLSFLKEE